MRARASSSSMAIGVWRGRAQSGLRAFFVQCGLLVGVPAGMLCAWLGTSLYAQVDPATGRPVSNGARNMWVTETSLSTSLYLAFAATGISLFGIVVGIALLLSGIGFMILAIQIGRAHV